MEEELLSRLQKLCGPKEMELNGGGWRKFAREDKRALSAAIDDLAVRGDDYHLGKVKNPAAYINSQYQFYHAKISLPDKATSNPSPDKSLSELVRESIYADHAKDGPAKPAKILPIPRPARDNWIEAGPEARKMVGDSRKQIGGQKGLQAKTELPA